MKTSLGIWAFGATAYMETLELAVELGRTRYRLERQRLGFDLYPYTEEAVKAVERSVLQWRFIDSVAGRIDKTALAAAQQGRTPCEPTSWCTRRSALDADRA